MKIKQTVAMLAALVAIETQAGLVVYYDQASFLANAGSVTVYDFESDSAGTISPPSYSGGLPGSVRDFGDFSIDATSTGIYVAGIREQGENMVIYLNSYNNNAALNVLFDDAVTAFGFNYVAEGNNYYDHSMFSLLGQTWDLGTPGASGFFGVVKTNGTLAAGTAFSFGQQSSNWSSLSFDNVTYSVPKPVSIAMIGLDIGWQSETGQNYSVLTTTNLVMAPWVPVVSGWTNSGTGGILIYTNAYQEDRRFFKVGTWIP